MSLRTYGFLVNITFAYQHGNPRHQTVIATLTRITVYITYVRIEHNIPVTVIKMIINGRPMGFRHPVIKQSFRISLIETHNHRVFLGRIKISRLIHHPFQLTTI